MPPLGVAGSDQLARKKCIKDAVELAPEMVAHPLRIELCVVRDLYRGRIREQVSKGLKIRIAAPRSI